MLNKDTIEDRQEIMTPKFFYFDMGRVLLDFDVDRMVCQMGLAAGVEAETVREVVFGGDLHRRYEAGQISSQAFYEAFCQATATRAPWSALAEAAGDIFEVNASMVPVVAQLRAAGYSMSILSNTSECHWQYCRRRYQFLELLWDKAALSYELGGVKPEAAVFEAAARLAGCAPEQIFFVDDIPGHVEGARSVGFDAVVYRSARQVVEDLRRRGVRLNY